MDYALHTIRCSLTGICHITTLSAVLVFIAAAAVTWRWWRALITKETNFADYSQIIPKLYVSTAGYGKQMELGRRWLELIELRHISLAVHFSGSDRHFGSHNWVTSFWLSFEFAHFADTNKSLGICLAFEIGYMCLPAIYYTVRGSNSFKCIGFQHFLRIEFKKKYGL